jgi:DNA-binding NtrC family response regulator/ligand-binding sensor domain-containing protein
MLKKLLVPAVLLLLKGAFSAVTPAAIQTTGVTQHNYHFDRLTLEDGLSQSIIYDIHQDRQGYMWFASEDGLNKYDGYNFRIFRKELGNHSSVSINAINSIFEDDEGMLWIGTYSGLNVFDPDTELFTRYFCDPDDPSSLSDNFISDITQDHLGNIWIATKFGLNKFDKKLKSFQRFYFEVSEKPHSESSNHLNAIMLDKNRNMWIGSHYGLFIFNTENETYQAFTMHNTENELPANSINAIAQTRDGLLWIGTHRGLCSLRANPFGNYKLTKSFNIPDNPNSISSNNVTAILEDSYGALWIGTMGGLNLFDRSQNKFYSFKHNPLDDKSISYNEIVTLHEDRSGNVWIGTYGGSISKLNRHAKPFEHFRNEPANPNSLNDNIVWSFAEDENDVLWVGTHSGGLNKYDRRTGEWTAFNGIKWNDQIMPMRSIHSLQIDSQATLWVGCNFGLVRFDRDHNSFELFQHEQQKSTITSNVTEIYEDNQQRLWIGYGSAGLGLHDRATNSFQHFVHDDKNKNSLSSDLVRVVYQDGAGAMWIGTNGGGLNRLDVETKTFTHFRYDADDTTTIASDFIYSITEDDAGQLWIATWGGGLDLFNRETQTFQHHTMRDGLPDNSLYAIVKDDQGFLWMSSNSGLARFDPKTRDCWTFNALDGLQSNEFNSGAFFKSDRGELFFGGINGFNYFIPDQITPNPTVPPLAITSFSIFSTPHRMIDYLNEHGQLDLNHNHYHISFEFAALEYTSPAKNRYAYKMEGFDKEWIYVNASKRLAGYSTLPPGEYTFMVKGSNNDGVWSETPLSVPVVINPPFYKTWLFRILLFLVIGSVVFFVFKTREKREREKKRLLEAHLAERTKAAEQLEKALDQVQKLKNRLEAENTYLQDEINVVNDFESIITVSPKMSKLLREVDQVAKTDATVLILGESGTGKELIAREIHNASNRSDRLLVKVNCAALPSNLIESELFGHERGSFTGAIKQKIGRFELADDGTIFLDEIGDLPLELQVKLLRVLQEGEFERIGGTQTIKVNTRVIAATNKDLRAAIKAGTFREDLYFRLNVFPVHLPPLRERPEDIPVLVNHFVTKYGADSGKTIMNIPKSVVECLGSYSWPGNVRELENIVERAMITSPKDRLVLNGWMPNTETNAGKKSFKTMTEAEKDHIINALKVTGWRVSGERGAAALLGMNPKTLESKMRKLKINRPKKEASRMS